MKIILIISLFVFFGCAKKNKCVHVDTDDPDYTDSYCVEDPDFSFYEDVM